MARNETFTVTIVDAAGNSGSGAVTLIVDDTAPQITSVAFQPSTVRPGQASTLTVKFADVDDPTGLTVNLSYTGSHTPAPTITPVPNAPAGTAVWTVTFSS